MDRLSRRVLAVAALLAACTVQDTKEPAAPTFDPLPPTTSHATILLAGRAEPGAKIHLRRDPEFPRDFKLPELVADPTNARFALEVPLADKRVNRFFAKVEDHVGLMSPETQTSITHGETSVSGVFALAEESRVRIGGAGSAVVKVRAQIRLSDPSGSLKGHALRFELAGYPVTSEPVLAETDAQGVAAAVFQGLTKLGPGRVVVTAPVLPGIPTDLAARDSVPFEVVTGEPASAAIKLSASVGGTPVNGTEITVPAGTEVRATVTAKDPAGNVVLAPWVLTTSPSDAFVTGGVVRFERAGTYEVNAFVQRTDVVAPPRASATVTVTADTRDATKTRLLVTVPPEAVSGEPVRLAARLVDEYDNEIPIQSMSATSSDQLATFDAAAPSITLQAAGEATITVRATRADATIVSAPPIPILVRAGAAKTLALTLDGQAAPITSPRAATPGAELTVGAVAKDAAGNVIPNAPVELTSDLGVDLFGRTVFAPTKGGLFAVNGVVPGTAARALAAFQVTSSAPARIEAACPSAAVAGVAFACSATVFDAFGNALATPVTWSVTPATGAQVQGSRLTLQAAGTVVVKAAATGLSSPAERSITVRPATPAQLRLTLSPTTPKVGQAVTATSSVVDAFGNVIPAVVVLSTDAPDALTSPLGVTNLTTPGTWRVFARATDEATRTTLHQNAEFTVSAEAAASLRVSLSPSIATVGTPVRVLATALDPYGNPATGSPTLTVNGAAPDQRTVLSEGTTLTFLAPGAYLVRAALGNTSGSAWLDVRPALDTTPPSVAFSLDRTGTTASGPFYAPGDTVRVSVRARDDDALAGVRVRVSSAELGLVFDGSSSWSGPRAEADESFTFDLPEGRVGAFTVTASAIDLAGNAVSATPAPATSDFHHDRFTLAGASLSARSVSIDPELGHAAALAFAGATLHVTTFAHPAESATAGSATSTVGAGGALTALWSYGDEAFPFGLASVTGTNGAKYLFTGTGNRTSRALNLLRLAPGVATPQRYTVPALATAAGSLDLSGPLLKGVTADGRSTVQKVYVAQLPESELGNPAATIWSAVAKTTPVGSVNPGDTTAARETWSVTLTDYRPEGLCVADVQNPTELFFTGTRHGAANTKYAGLYRLPLQTTGAPGHVGAAGAPATVFEEARDLAGGARVVYGGCVHAPGSGNAAKLAFTRWTVTAGVAAAGRVSQVSLPCTGACTAVDLAAGTASAPLGALPALVRGVAGATGGTAALYVSEGGAGRVFRLDGVF